MEDNEEPSSSSKRFRRKCDTEIDNSKHLVRKIATLYAERLMNDICLVVDGVEYPAHRIILCTSSEVFQVMLMNPSWSESRTNRVVLQETKPCAQIFEKFLRYFYTGQISINESTVLPIIALADKYIVKDLMQVCTNYICNNIASSNNNVVSCFQYTLGLGHMTHSIVAQACQDYIKWNFEKVAETSDFLNFTPDILCKFLTQNDIVIQNEKELLKYVIIWLEHQLDLMIDDGSYTPDDVSAHMQNLVETVIAYIRFPMINSKELAQLLLYPLVQTYKDFFIDRITIGVAYHNGSNRGLKSILNSTKLEDRLLFTPRLYTDDKFSSLLHITNFQSLPAYHSRTLVFTSHSNPCDNDEDERPVEWVIDVYPKGVWFDKFSLIVWQGTIELPQVIKRTVRLSITCKDPPQEENDDLRVKLGILIYGIQNDVQHVKLVKQKTLRFNDKDRVYNFDDLLNYSELNPINTRFNSTEYLCGIDTLKLKIIIIPLSTYSVIDPCQVFIIKV